MNSQQNENLNHCVTNDSQINNSRTDNIILGASGEPYLIDFCLECGLHCDYCDSPNCDFNHCSGYSIFCTKNNCICDKTQQTECRFANTLNNNEKNFNGKHIVRLSNICVQWCKTCKAHYDCELDECSFNHCVCGA